MANFNRIQATLLLIRHCLAPGKGSSTFPRQAAGDSFIRIPSERFADLLPLLDSCLRPNGSLELLFEEALAPAAPCLLFRLKRQGFSDCRAVVTREGILLTARR